LQRRIDQLLGLDKAQGELLQGQRYRVGQEFKPHTDWFQRETPGWAHERLNGGQRAFTAMVYLNSIEHGGETDFPRLDLAVAPRQGTLLVWNNADRDGVPNPFTLHAGNPVGNGTKYVITQWYRARRRS
jgi:2OG-Fe(II) oxygenase superfamily.